MADFRVFCPKAVAAIGDLPDTIRDRSIPILLRRRAPTETVERFRLRRVKPAGLKLRADLEAWAVGAKLGDHEPELPDALDDRAADGWEVLLAVADTAGGDWPEQARAAAKTLHAAQEEDHSLGVRLLADLKRVFGSEPVLFTREIMSRLNQLVESPWGGFRLGQGIDGRGLASLLRPFGVRPKDVRIGTENGKGYHADGLRDAWARYVPAGGALEPRRGDNPATTRGSAAPSGSADSDKNPGNPAEPLDCRGVAAESASEPAARDGVSGASSQEAA